MAKQTLTDSDIIRIADYVASRSKVRDFEEAFEAASYGIAYAIHSYDPTKSTAKLSTYAYKCAVMECKKIVANYYRKRTGYGYITVSLDQLAEKGYVLDQDNKIHFEGTYQEGNSYAE